VWISLPTDATVDVFGNLLVMHIPKTEMPLPFDEDSNIHMATWTLQSEVDVGDDTAIETFMLEAPARCKCR